MIERFLIKHGNMERTMPYGGLCLFLGFGLIGIAFLGAPIGGLPGVMAMMYGACCGTFYKSYRTPGMWLVALGFGVIVIPCYLILAWLRGSSREEVVLVGHRAIGRHEHARTDGQTPTVSHRLQSPYITIGK